MLYHERVVVVEGRKNLRSPLVDGQQPLASLLFRSNTILLDICCTYQLVFQTRFPSLHLCGSRFKVTAEFQDSLLKPTTT